MATSPRRTNLKPPGKCIFCDRTGSLSKEHIWAEWLEQIVPQTADSHRIQSYKVRFADSEDTGVTHRQGPLHHRKIRNVCETCNNGWMSRLEEKDAAPILTPMILGQDVLLREQELKILVRWLVKTSIMISCLYPPMMIKKIDCHRIRRLRRPPLTWQIFIGFNPECAGQFASHWTRTHLSLSPPRVSTDPPGNLASLFWGVGQLICLAVISYVDGNQFRLNPMGDGEHRMVQIWPVKEIEIRWPPAHTLSTADMVSYGYALQRLIHRIAQEVFPRKPPSSPG